MVGEYSFQFGVGVKQINPRHLLVKEWLVRGTLSYHFPGLSIRERLNIKVWHHELQETRARGQSITDQSCDLQSLVQWLDAELRAETFESFSKHVLWVDVYIVSRLPGAVLCWWKTELDVPNLPGVLVITQAGDAYNISTERKVTRTPQGTDLFWLDFSA